MKWLEALEGLERNWQIRIVLILFLHGIFPIFFLRAIEAQVVLAIYLLSIATHFYIEVKTGSPLLAKISCLWFIPLLVWLPFRWEFHSFNALLGFWLRVVVIADALIIIHFFYLLKEFSEIDRSDRDLT